MSQLDETGRRVVTREKIEMKWLPGRNVVTWSQGGEVKGGV